MAKAQLQLSDDEYRDLMSTVCAGVRSAAQLDFTGRRRFLAHLQACLRHQQPAAKVRHIPAPLTPAQRLMWSLWMRLADAGLVTERTMAALEAFARRQTGVDRLQWLNPQQADLVVTSLKQWLKRGSLS
ncbi:MAG: hypothetical protein RL375_3385 [Pseudomonadota bacterium]|jgi:hypothetical protein